MLISLLNNGPRGQRLLLVSARPSGLDMFFDALSADLRFLQDAFAASAKAAMRQITEGVVSSNFGTANGANAHAAVRMHAHPTADTCWFYIPECGKKYDRFQRWRVAT